MYKHNFCTDTTITLSLEALELIVKKQVLIQHHIILAGSLFCEIPACFNLQEVFSKEINQRWGIYRYKLFDIKIYPQSVGCRTSICQGRKNPALLYGNCRIHKVCKTAFVLLTHKKKTL